MAGRVKINYPSHVLDIPWPENFSNFLLNDRVRNGAVNLGLHSFSDNSNHIGRRARVAIASFSDAARHALSGYHDPGIATINVSHVFDRIRLETTNVYGENTKDIPNRPSDEFLECMKAAGIDIDPKMFRALAINIIMRAKFFLGSLTQFQVLKEPPKKTLAAERVSACLKFIGAPNPLPSSPIFWNPSARPENEPEWMCHVNLSVGYMDMSADERKLKGSGGMRWFGNDNVRRETLDGAHPERANVIYPDQFYELQVGQAAYFPGDPLHGLAICLPAPLHPGDPPCVYLELRRYVCG